MPGDTAAEVTGADLRRAVAAIEKSTNGSWLARHQTWTIAIVGVIVGAVSWGVNRWTREQVLEVQAPIDAKQDERAGALGQRIEVETKARADAVETLQQNDQDFAEYAEESDRYEQAVLDGVADKLRVLKPDREPLDRATKRLRKIKDRRRGE